MPYFSIKMNTLLLVSVLITRPPNVRGWAISQGFFVILKNLLPTLIACVKTEVCECVYEMRTFFFFFFFKLQWRVFQSRFPYPLSPWVGWLVVSNITFSCSYLSEAPDVMTTACLNVRKLLSGHCFWRVSKSSASFDWMVFLPISSITPRLSFKP